MRRIKADYTMILLFNKCPTMFLGIHFLKDIVRLGLEITLGKSQPCANEWDDESSGMSRAGEGA